MTNKVSLCIILAAYDNFMYSFHPIFNSPKYMKKIIIIFLKNWVDLTQFQKLAYRGGLTSAGGPITITG